MSARIEKSDPFLIKNWRLLAYITTLVFAAGFAWAQMEDTTAKVDTVAVKVDSNENRIETLEKSMAEQRIHFQYIKQGIEDIKNVVNKNE